MNYINTDIGNMRRDALRRTREMYRQNNVEVGMQNRDNDSKTAAENIPVSEISPENASVTKRKDGGGDKLPKKPEKQKNTGLNGLLSGIFTDGRLDSDKIIIIALIIILAREGADLKLLLALGYILI